MDQNVKGWKAETVSDEVDVTSTFQWEKVTAEQKLKRKVQKNTIKAEVS